MIRPVPDPERPGTPHSSSAFDGWLAGGILLTWILVLPRLIPTRDVDRGIFVSVAERLLAGDTLYSTVYDNKEPLFYYLVAMERALGAWGEWGGEALLVLASAIATWSLARLVAGRWPAAAVGFIGVPLVLTGHFYHPGLTHLPGVALVLVGTALVAYGRPWLAGIALALAVFVKLVMGPVALAAAGTMLLMRRSLGEALQLVAAGVLTSLALVGLLAWRGELVPFVETTLLNIRYANGKMIYGATGLAAIGARLSNVSLEGRFMTVVFALGATACLGFAALGTDRLAGRRLGFMASALVATLVAAIVVLGLTGLWIHHNQILYAASLLALVVLAALVDRSQGRHGAKLGAVVFSAFLLGNVTGPQALVQPLLSVRQTFAALSELSPEAKSLLALGPTGTYARLGFATDQGHAYGLRGWTLACPRFHQYPWDSKPLLDLALSCARNAPVLLVSDGLNVRFNWVDEADWLAFRNEVEEVLRADYACQAAEGARVCRRRTPAPAGG